MKNTLLSNGRRIAFYTSGNAEEALPLVLLHGFCEDASLWLPVMPLLGEKRVVRIDLPGFGASQQPLSTNMRVYSDAVCAVLNELGIGQCVLAGHSMGGYAALDFAGIYPERLAGLGLVHSHPFEDAPDRKENRRRGIAMVQARKKNLYVAQLFPGLFAPDFARAHPEVVQTLIRRGQQQSVAGIAAALEAMILRADTQNALREAACPVLFLLGELDSIIPPDWALSAAILPQITDVNVLPGVGHMGMFEAPDETAGILLRFSKYCLQQASATSLKDQQRPIRK